MSKSDFLSADEIQLFSNVNIAFSQESATDLKKGFGPWTKGTFKPFLHFEVKQILGSISHHRTRKGNTSSQSTYTVLDVLQNIVFKKCGVMIITSKYLPCFLLDFKKSLLAKRHHNTRFLTPRLYRMSMEWLPPC